MIPDKIIGFKCYNEGSEMIGITDATIPDIAFMTESMKGAGLIGEMDIPALGQVQSMTTTINWRSLIEENIVLFAPKTYHFEFRGSVQIYDHNSGDFNPKELKVVMKCIPKKGALGKLNVATQMGTSGEYEVTYLKVAIESRELVEIDKFAYICKIDGVDYLAKVRSDLGM